jgi:hypothetical protein
MDKLSNKEIFNYVITFIIILFIFSRIDISLNILYGTFIGIIVLVFIYNDNQRKKNIHNDIIELEKSDLIPQKKYINNHEDVINFLFSIQDLYVYNPQEYIVMMDNIDHLFEYLELSHVNPCKAGVNFSLMKDCKKDAVDSLNSIIVGSVVNKDVAKKINKASVTLNSLLNKYLTENKELHEKYVYENGYTCETPLITKIEDPEPKNLYDLQNDSSRIPPYSKPILTYEFM